MRHEYKTSPAVCSESVSFTIEENGTLSDIKFNGGCPGSLSAVCALVEGLTVEEAVKRISGIKCGSKITSCPDQLAQALKKYL